MAILFAANAEGPDGLQGSIEYNTETGMRRPDTARQSYHIGGGSPPITATVAPQTRFVGKRYIRQLSNSGISGQQWFNEFRDGATARIRCHPDTSAGFAVRVVSVDGASETVLFVTSSFLPTPTGNGAMGGFDIEIDINYTEEGWVRAYVNETLVGEFIGDPRVGGSTTLDTMAMRGLRSAASWGEHRTSNIMIADDSLVGVNLCTTIASGAGFENEWDGSHTAINNTGAPNANVISSDTSGESYFFAMTDIPSALGLIEVRELIARVQAQKGSSGPDALAQRIRHDGTNYAGTTHSLDTGLDWYEDRWALNPDTSEPWTKADLDALQLGCLSETI